MCPKWLFDLDSLTQSMNYVPVVAGTFSNVSAGIQEVSESSTSSQQDQDCIIMPIWKDASYFDDASLKSVADAQIQDQDGTHDDCSFQDNGIDDQQVNTASPQVNTGSREVSTATPEINTATPEGLMGPIPTTEDTQVEDQDIELGNISPSYEVSSTPHTRIHKDHPIEEQKRVSKVLLIRMVEAMQEVSETEDEKRGGVVCRQPPGFEDLNHPDKVYKVVIAHILDFHSCTQSLKFNYTDVESLPPLLRLEKPLVKDADADDVDEHLYRSMIGSLMYLTASRPDIMFAVCACARFQVSPKTSHLLAVKRIFRYLKGKPSLGLWYSKDSPLELIAYTDSDYAGATQDRKSTTGGCQFLGNRLISWQCKKQTVVATSTTEAEYVAAANCCGQLDFCDKHNMVAFLEKSTGSAGFHQIIDFISRSHICYALTKKPEVCVSFIKQFWRSAAILTDDNGNVKIHATIDGHSLSITEGSLRRHLKLDDQDGITSLPTTEIFAQLALMGYATDSDKLTFQKGAFSPQWRFLIHTILHCLSPKKTAWEQFSSNIAAAVICLATNRKFNFSRMIFDNGGLTYLGEVLEAVLTKIKEILQLAILSFILRVKNLEAQLKVGESKETFLGLFFSDMRLGEDDFSKQGRKFSMMWSSDEEFAKWEKASDEVSTAGKKRGPISEEVPTVSTAEATLSTAGGTVTYSRRSAEKRSRKDKGKAILIEEEPTKKLRRDIELRTRLLDSGKKKERKVVMDEAESTKKIDWNDP
ncbi:hypothetical protein Tco_1053960 [Tanacetum coccineum]|uniref:Reverse transcriptase Ty1/copia-type domain-containing protein n=1 Tax=Tanacetum coccineum TaxID=301880 RepID=A0ABQ5GVD3_9ASTR